MLPTRTSQDSTDRPGPLTAAVLLLAASWLIIGGLSACGTWRAWRGVHRVAESGTMPPDFAVGAGVDGALRNYWALLLVVLGVLCWAIPKALRGRQAGRGMLWGMAALLGLEPLRLCITAIVQGEAEPTPVFFAVVGAVAAIVAAVLLALPTVSAYVRASTRVVGVHRP